MTSRSASPSPIHLLRSHTAQLTALAFSDDNERIYSGDASGLVVVTSTRSLRAIASWKAHSNGLLGVEEWKNRVITFASPLSF
jgi:WD40 repeat protein